MTQSSIDINDVDTRTVTFSATGVDGSAVYSIALVPYGQPVLDGDYIVVNQTAGSTTLRDIPFGTTFNCVALGGVGRYSINAKVTDQGNVATLTSLYVIDFTDRTA